MVLGGDKFTILAQKDYYLCTFIMYSYFLILCNLKATFILCILICKMILGNLGLFSLSLSALAGALKIETSYLTKHIPSTYGRDRWTHMWPSPTMAEYNSGYIFVQFLPGFQDTSAILKFAF